MMHNKIIRSGFTVIELIIVIVVIGVLASVVLVNFSDVRTKGTDSVVQSELRDFGDQIATYSSTNLDGYYPANNDTALAAVGIMISKKSYETSSGGLLYCTKSDYSDFAILAQSKTGKIFAYTSNGELKPYTTYTSLTNYSAICTSFMGANYPRYGFSSVWRPWVAG